MSFDVMASGWPAVCFVSVTRVDEVLLATRED